MVFVIASQSVSFQNLLVHASRRRKRFVCRLSLANAALGCGTVAVSPIVGVRQRLCLPMRQEVFFSFCRLFLFLPPSLAAFSSCCRLSLSFPLSETDRLPLPLAVIARHCCFCFPLSLVAALPLCGISPFPFVLTVLPPLSFADAVRIFFDRSASSASPSLRSAPFFVPSVFAAFLFGLSPSFSFICRPFFISSSSPRSVFPVSPSSSVPPRRVPPWMPHAVDFSA